MNSIKTALVVGGGIAGMCAAIGLGRAGVEVELVEIDPDWMALGAGLTMNGASLRAFRELGLLDEVMEKGYCHDVRRLFDAEGNLTFESPADRQFGADIPNGGGILRPVLHGILQQAVRNLGTTVCLGNSIASLVEHADHVRASFAGGGDGAYDIVVGADGFHSPLRKRLFPDAPPSIFTYQGCWRAVVPRPSSITGGCMFLGSQKVGVNPVSQDEMYLFLLQNLTEYVWMPQDRWRDLLVEQLGEFGGIIATIRANLDENSRINYRPLYTHVLDSPWHRGRILLVGDAVHATTPHAAYGAGLAVEDGVVLSQLVGEGVGFPDLFERFMERRFEKCRKVVEGSVRIGEVERAHGDVAQYRAAWDEVYDAVRMPV